MTTQDLPGRLPTYQGYVDAAKERGFERLGLRSSASWASDPKHLVFRLARYKFVAKMLSGNGKVLEVGIGDGFGTRIVQQEVQELAGTDYDPAFIQDIEARMVDGWRFRVFTHDFIKEPLAEKFDAVYALDVLEHIDPKFEEKFLGNLFACLRDPGMAVFGIPSLESQAYASPGSREGHVNCKSMPAFRETMLHYFHYVLMFSMNDEVVHTGYHKMAHYLFAVCCGPKSGQPAAKLGV